LRNSEVAATFPVVHLVAHVERLSDQWLQLDRSGDLQGDGEYLAELGRHPSEARQHLGPVGAETERFAEPSFRFEKVLWPCSPSRTIHTGIDGLIMPAIGPTAP